MALIYSSFSQINERILHNLIGEYTDLMDYFNSKEIKAKVDFQVAYGKKVNAITSELIEHQKDLKIFHYSGHSDAEGLNFEEEDFQKEQVINFFNTLNSHEVGLDCVFLNGCTNEAIVQRLTQVPVVIGTKSPIRNDTAIKFTSDFFKALISGNQSYEAAFTQASSALPAANRGKSIVRGIGWSEPTNQSKPGLDEYFMVINDPKVAKRGFPIKKKKANWLIYIALLLTILGGGWAYLNWDSFSTQARGFDCPVWQSEEKCNVLVIDFNEEDYNEFLSEAINTNPVMSEYMEGDYRLNYSDLIPDDSDVNEKELPERCNFEYMMTGDVGISGEGKKMMSVEMIPYLHSERVVKEIGTLWDMKQVLLQVRDVFKEQYVISQVCVACAAKNEKIMAIADEVIEKLVDEKGAEEAYQELNEDMSFLYLQKEDTSKAILALKKVAAKDFNDKALAAREAVGEFEIKMGNIENAYLTHSKYITSVERRLELPQNFKLSQPIENYKMAQKTMMLKRANLVIEHPERLSKYRRQALQDFRFLQQEKFQNRDFNNQIKLLCEILGEQCEEEDVEVSPPFHIKVTTQAGAIIENAIVYFQDQRFQSIDGIIAIPCDNDECIGQMVEIRAAGYKEKEVRLQGENRRSSVRLEKISLPKLAIKGKVVGQNNQPISRAQVKFGDWVRTTNRSGEFDFGEFEAREIPAQEIIISKINYPTKKVRVGELVENRTILLFPLPDEKIKIDGYVMDQSGSAIAEATVVFGQQDKRTDGNGYFDFGKFEKEQLPDRAVYVSKDKFKAKTVLVNTLLENRKITLTLAPQRRKVRYTISGKVNDCKFRMTTLKEIFINRNRVPIKMVTNNQNLTALIQESVYSYQLEATPGQTISITVPRGYSIGNSSAATFTLTNTTSITKDLNIIKNDDRSYKVMGQLMYNNEPIIGGQIMLDGATNRGAVTDMEGKFSFTVQGYFCNTIKITFGRYKSKTFELRYYPPKNGAIQLGKVEVR